MKPGGDPPRRGAWPTPPRPGERRPEPPPAKPAPPETSTARSNAREQAPAPPIPKPAPPGKAAPPRSPVQPQSPAPTAKQPFRGGPTPARKPALISRGERLLFWALLPSVLAMAVFLVRFRNRTEAHFQARALAVPLASAGGSTAPLILSLANDQTGALTERPLAFPLPQDLNTRARVVLQKLLAEYTAPGSPHPLHALPSGAQSVDEVYLSPAPGVRGELATVDLTSDFIHLHPSGIEPETLTLLSIMATLHANLPQITEVRFLVDGEPRATLAGHANLDQTYLAGPAQTAPSEAFTQGPNRQ